MARFRTPGIGMRDEHATTWPHALKCVISSLLSKLYSEFMLREAMEEMEGISFGGFNITDLRYADDAVLESNKKKKLQKMIDKLNETCKEYGMDIKARKT